MTPKLIQEFVFGLVRHTLTFGGGGLITHGLATDSEVNTFIAAAMTGLGLLWSWARKWKRERSGGAS